MKLRDRSTKDQSKKMAEWIQTKAIRSSVLITLNPQIVRMDLT